MKKRVLIALAVSLALVLAMVIAASSVWAKGPKGAEKVPLVETPDGGWSCATGATATAPTFGFAILNTNANGVLNVEAVVKRALPNTLYTVWVNQYPGGCPQPGHLATLTTDADGNGNAHVQVYVIDGATEFWVSVVTYSPVLHILRSPAAQLEVVGGSEASADGRGAYHGEAYDSLYPQLGLITYLATPAGYHFWFTPVADLSWYVADHSYHNVYQVTVGDPGEWCGPIPVGGNPNRAPYNLVGHEGESVYYKIFDTTTDTQICP